MTFNQSVRISLEEIEAKLHIGGFGTPRTYIHVHIPFANLVKKSATADGDDEVEYGRMDEIDITLASDYRTDKESIEISVYEARTVLSDKKLGSVKLILYNLLCGPSKYEVDLVDEDGNLTGDLKFNVKATIKANTKIAFRGVTVSGLIPTGYMEVNPQVQISFAKTQRYSALTSSVAFGTLNPFWAVLGMATPSEPVTLREVLEMTASIVVNSEELGGTVLMGVTRIAPFAKYVSVTPGDFVYFSEPLYRDRIPAGNIEGYINVTELPQFNPMEKMMDLPEPVCHIKKNDAFISNPTVVFMGIPVPSIKQTPPIRMAEFQMAPRMYPPPRFSPGAPSPVNIIANSVAELQKPNNNTGYVQSCRMLTEMVKTDLLVADELYDRRAPTTILSLAYDSDQEDVRVEASRLLAEISRADKIQEVLTMLPGAIEKIMKRCLTNTDASWEFSFCTLANVAGNDTASVAAIEAFQDNLVTMYKFHDCDNMAVQAHLLRLFGNLLRVYKGNFFEPSLHRFAQKIFIWDFLMKSLKSQFRPVFEAAVYAAKYTVRSVMPANVLSLITTLYVETKEADRSAALISLLNRAYVKGNINNVLKKEKAETIKEVFAKLCAEAMSNKLSTRTEAVACLETIISAGILPNVGNECTRQVLQTLMKSRPSADTPDPAAVDDMRLSLLEMFLRSGARLEEIATKCLNEPLTEPLTLTQDPNLEIGIAAMRCFSAMMLATGRSEHLRGAIAAAPYLVAMIAHEPSPIVTEAATLLQNLIMNAFVGHKERAQFLNTIVQSLADLLKNENPSIRASGIYVLHDVLLKSDKSELGGVEIKVDASIVVALVPMFNETPLAKELLTFISRGASGPNVLAAMMELKSSGSGDTARAVVSSMLNDDPEQWIASSKQVDVLDVIAEHPDASKHVIGALRRMMTTDYWKNEGSMTFVTKLLDSDNKEVVSTAVLLLCQAYLNPRFAVPRVPTNLAPFVRAYERGERDLVKLLVVWMNNASRVFAATAGHPNFVPALFDGLKTHTADCLTLINTIIGANSVVGAVSLPTWEAALPKMSVIYDLIKDDNVFPMQMSGLFKLLESATKAIQGPKEKVQAVVKGIVDTLDWEAVCYRVTHPIGSGETYVKTLGLLLSRLDGAHKSLAACMPALKLLVDGIAQPHDTPTARASAVESLNALNYVLKNVPGMHLKLIPLVDEKNLMGLLTAERDVSEPAKLFSEAIGYREICSFFRSGEKYVTQDTFECLTCGLSDGDSLCSGCVKTCHAGHNVKPLGTSSFFCHCGRAGQCLASSPVGFSAQTAISLCSFVLTGMRPRTQDWFNCRTCWGPRTDIGACGNCAKVCHSGHNVVEADTSPMFCNCGAGGQCSNLQARR